MDQNKKWSRLYRRLHFFVGTTKVDAEEILHVEAKENC